MPNSILLKRDTPIIFGSGGTAFSLANLAVNTGWKSARLDQGAGSKPYKFSWIAYVEINSTISDPDGSKSFDLYVIQSDGTKADGNFTVTTEGIISSLDKRFNLKPLGTIIIDSPSVTSFTASGEVEITTRYFSLAIFNFSGVAISSSATNSGAIITPLIEEIN